MLGSGVLGSHLLLVMMLLSSQLLLPKVLLLGLIGSGL